jgi:hypothetical protein
VRAGFTANVFRGCDPLVRAWHARHVHDPAHVAQASDQRWHEQRPDHTLATTHTQNTRLSRPEH